MAGTLGRVYGGDPALIHIADGQRRTMGKRVATFISEAMRDDAKREGESFRDMVARRFINRLCPGCYQVALFNAAVELAKKNGQSLTELGRTMGAAFARLEADGDAAASAQGLEEIACLIDPPEELGARLDAQEHAFDAFAASGALDGLEARRIP